MKIVLHLCFVLALSVAARSNPASTGPAPALSAEILTAVRAADDARISATLAADREALAALLSDDLRYAHSSGNVDSKAAFIEAIATGRTRYLAIEYAERLFTPAAPGVVLMSGRCAVKATSGAQPLDLQLSFLAVWREERGQWRFLAWQSARVPASSPAPTK